MQYFKEYSPALGREMECKVYGHGGRPMLYILSGRPLLRLRVISTWPTPLHPGSSRAGNMVMSIDTLDKETWSDTNGDPYWRIRRYEQWLRYIVDEVVPAALLSKERNGWDDLPGVTPSAAARRDPCGQPLPPLARHLLRLSGLSGIYTAHYGFGDYMDELVYMNSPVDYMRNFPEDHPYMELYRNQKAVICCGQAHGSSPTPPGCSSASLRQRTSLSGWTCGATTSSTTGIGGISMVYYMPYILG